LRISANYEGKKVLRRLDGSPAVPGPPGKKKKKKEGKSKGKEKEML